MMRIRRHLLLPGLLVLLVLCGCDRPTVPGEGARAPGDTLIVGSIGEPNTLLPVLASDSASSAVNSLVYDGLIGLDKNLGYEPRLARSWEILDDGLTLVFHLRDDVRWHDGGKLAFSLARLAQLTEEGYAFQSHIDGSRHLLTPEKAVEIQAAINSDILMCLDQCTAYPAERAAAQAA